MRRLFFLIPLTLLALILTPNLAGAQSALQATADTSVSCDQAAFTISIDGGSAPYVLHLDYGDGETLDEAVDTTSFSVQHTYPAPDTYEWSLTVGDALEGEFETEGEIAIDGPAATLTSDPFPPMLTLENGSAEILFSAQVNGGVEPYAYSWDFEGDGVMEPESGAAATALFTTGGEYQASVVVSDACGLTGSDSLTVEVIDPEEAPEKACHPTAQKIADAVSSLFPDRAEKLYTCEDIFAIFEGSLTGTQLGFGRMWHAYQLSQVIDDLSWEEMLDWQLQGTGWGLLTQLNRFAEALDEIGIRDLYERVMSGENTVGELRSALQAVVRYEADFEDALARLAAGASNGEIGQFYRLAQDLEVPPETLDGYLGQGASLADLRHAAKFAERYDADWMQIAEARLGEASWGEIGQAYKLADESISPEDILAMGVQAYREQQRDEAKQERETARLERQEARNLEIAAKLGEPYGLSAQEVLDLFNGDCEQKWSCVRKTLREQTTNGQDERTAAHIASQYGQPEDLVWSQYDACGQDWSCVRAFFREQTRGEHGKGKGK